MKVLVAIDDSPYSKIVVDAVCNRRWPTDTQFKLLSVLEPLPVSTCECECGTFKTLKEINKKRNEQLHATANEARHKIEKAVPTAGVHYEIEEGDPKVEIVKAAVEWEADRILVGAHGRTICPHFLPGSVSRSVVKNAHCTCEVIQDRSALPEKQLA
jgi:nucleotide-binding universal stress UspA family protein